MSSGYRHIKRAVVLLGATALVISFILCIHALNGSGLIGCSQGSSCNAVLGSRWSFILGIIPVSGLACMLYSLFTACAIMEGRTGDESLDHFLRMILMVISGAIAGSAAWFIWIQAFRIRAFCPYCMSAHIIGLVASGLTTAWCCGKEKSILTKAACPAAGLLLAGALAGLQILTTPLTAYERGFIPEDLPSMDDMDLPYAGRADAQETVTLLFDYQCNHCQKIHSLMPELMERLGGRVRIILCPTPLSPECNPYVPAGGTDNFKGSCELAGLSLALWTSNRDAFKEFDSWLFSSEQGQWRPRSVGDAREKAAELIGYQALEEALDNEFTGRYLARASELFGRTSREGHGAIPRFIHGSRWLTPDADDAAGLAELIEELIEE